MSDVNDTIQVCYFAAKIGPAYKKLLILKDEDKKIWKDQLSPTDKKWKIDMKKI